MKIIISSILIVLLCIGGTYLYFTQEKKRQELLKSVEGLKYDYQLETGSKDFALSTMKEDMNMCYQNEGKMLDPQMRIYENGKEMNRLSDVIQEKTLVVRFSQLNCQACITALTPLLKKLKGKRVIFLADYTNKRYLKEFQKAYNTDHRFFKIEALPIPMEELNVPYFFLLDKKLEIDCIFIPHKEMLDQVEKYLEVIKDKI